MPGGSGDGKEAKAMGNKTGIKKGDRVCDVEWGGKFTGTVVRTATSSQRRWVFVQWDDVAGEDQLLEYGVEALGTRLEGEITPVVKIIEIGWRS